MFASLPSLATLVVFGGYWLAVVAQPPGRALVCSWWGFVPVFVCLLVLACTRACARTCWWADWQRDTRRGHRKRGLPILPGSTPSPPQDYPRRPLPVRRRYILYCLLIPNCPQGGKRETQTGLYLGIVHHPEAIVLVGTGCRLLFGVQFGCSCVSFFTPDKQKGRFPVARLATLITL